MQDRIFMSDDPKDPKFRIRVHEAIEEAGLVSIVEEDLTSTKPTAQVTEERVRLCLTPTQARWLLAALSDVLRVSSPAPTATTAPPPGPAPRGEGSSEAPSGCICPRTSGNSIMARHSRCPEHGFHVPPRPRA